MGAPLKQLWHSDKRCRGRKERAKRRKISSGAKREAVGGAGEGVWEEWSTVCLLTQNLRSSTLDFMQKSAIKKRTAGGSKACWAAAYA
jgi:hypothetical protein